MFNLYFRNTHVSLYYDKELRLGKAVWRGHVQGAEFREATLLCLDLVDRHELRGWLGDNRKMNSIDPADLQWSLEVFVPQAVASPLLRIANLPSESEKNREAVAMMLKKKDQLDAQQLLVRDFGSEEEAMAWLMEL
ncbi:hypothetical protein C8N40_101331 [Pontibacter mucosus]|uniref:SpoIIAA-like protein n=1 Tax=Pontibacter mucosus TaxID=1649266 RepID=A0A2T5YT55_9BACT|nr:hypothetical protein [Pontibacter mucosus]PTX22507.1 hypothetical protein C8N40_101331 [Pontibacter mucosus]